MEELSAEDLQQLEERLYSQVHHSFENSTDNSEQTKNDDNSEQNTSTSTFLSKRYWANKINSPGTGTGTINNEYRNKVLDNRPTGHMKRNQPQQQPHEARINATTSKQAKPNPNNTNDKIRNPFAAPQKNNFKNKKPNHNSFQTKQNHRTGGPFAEKFEKIQRVNQFHNKKQKANDARAKMLANPKIVETINLDLDEDDDEVIIVPIPPTPVVSIDDSDEEMPINDKQQIVPQTNAKASEALPENASRCASPASVMSHDEFIGQGDRTRLLIVNNNADSFLEAPIEASLSKENSAERRTSSDDIECIGTFIKPKSFMINSKEKVAGKQDYRVGGSGFRACDVYESESDIVSDGVYSKGSGRTQMLNTSAHNSVNNSDDDVEDISINPSKTKRLRKRRASTTLRSSESNGAGSSDSDGENDGVVETGVPFIYRGPALESQKSKKKRGRTISTVSSGRMSDTEFVATLNSLAKGNDDNGKDPDDNDSESDSVENMPTARDIAERVLNTKETVEEQNDDVIEVPCTSSTLVQNDDAIPAEVVDDVERIFSKIIEFNEKKAQEELSDDDDYDITVESHVLAASDESTCAMDIEPAEKEKNDDDGDKIKYFTASTPANYKCFSDGFGWNEEMRRFYNYSWGGENFREDTILRSMKRSPQLWRISGADRFPNIMPRGKREKCMNCLSFGHSRARCPKPKRPMVCYMCGESGHLEARCPNTRCLRCGNVTMSFAPSCKRCMYWNNRICPICKLRGHSLNDCPDKWRRYHSTVKPNEFPEARIVYNRRRYCCFCGMRGHLSDECRKAVHRTEYPIIASEIKSFEKSYDDVIMGSYQTPGVKCRLLYDPKCAVNFTLAEKTTRFLTYGRFLNYVGLGKLIGAKNLNARQNITSPATVTASSNTPSKPADKSLQIVEVAQASTSSSDNSPFKAQNKSKTQTATATTIELPSTSRSNMPPPPARAPAAPLDFDSDSNYSFSEHFEVSSSVDQAPAAAKVQTAVTAPLPDFISLGGGGDRFKETTDVQEIEDTPELGISSRFVVANSDDETHETDVASDFNRAAVQNKPCEAKIFISDETNRYFQSKAGQEYLCKVLPEHDLTGSLDKTIAGYALSLTGLPINQEKFQQTLLNKYEELNKSKIQQQIDNQVPKNVKPLIRFLRDSINQLQNNLGSATDLYKKMYDLEKWQTKSGMKSADRIRRTLNMIFLGQAGLDNGDVHFGVLLKALRTLLNEFGNTEKVPKELREEINTSWRSLFTSYDHKRYATLLAAYIQLPAFKRNRIPALNIDPNMLGNAVLDVSLNKEQKERLNDFTKNVPIKTEFAMEQQPPVAAKESVLMLNVVLPEQQPPQPQQPQQPQQQLKQQTNNKKLSNQTETFSAISKESNQTLDGAGTKSATAITDIAQQQVKALLPFFTENNKKLINSNDGSSDLSPPFELLSKSNTPNGSTLQTDSKNSPTPDATSSLDQEFCLIALKAIEDSFAQKEIGARTDASKVSSQFWSSKSKELLDELLQLAKSSKSSNLERLEHIHKLAADNKLSFSNHSDLLKIHKQIIKK